LYEIDRRFQKNKSYEEEFVLRKMIIIAVACLMFPIAIANSSLEETRIKRSAEISATREMPVVNKKEGEIYLYATGYYHPEEDQDFYATDSYEEDLELNGKGITASGKRARKGYVAVDPDVIPLGTEFYTEEYGILKAEDTGGKIKGNRIDIFTGDGQRALIKALGINKWIKVRVTKWGGQ
jgi:3D (Asp-Asp-Asp) domain-containing protein